MEKLYKIMLTYINTLTANKLNAGYECVGLMYQIN